MQSPFGTHRRAGSILAAALFVLGAASVWAQPRVTVATTGEVLSDGKARFTIVVTNRGDDLGDEPLYLYDPLPGIGIVAWDHDSPTPDEVGCGVAKGNAPDPSQEVLECLMSGLAHGESRTVAVTSLDPVEPGCMSLVNEAFAYWPRPATPDHRDLPPPGASASYNLVAGLCAARIAGSGSFVAAANGTANGNRVSVTHAFEVRCRASDPRQQLEILWPGAGNRENGFRLVTLTSATCLDDPAIGLRSPSAGFNTFVGEGWGWCNGEPASIAFALTDGAAAGTADTVEFQIYGDACELDAGVSTLATGDQQAHR